MNKQRLAILIVASLGGLATFMPWLKVPIVGSINGTQGDGWITLVLFAVPIIISLLNDRTEALAGVKLYGAIIPGIIAGIIGIWKIIDFHAIMSDTGDNPFTEILSSSVSIEFGLYLVVLAGIALPVVAFSINHFKNEAKPKEEMWNEIIEKFKKRNYLIFGIIGIILLVAILTNPNQNRHKEVVKNKLNASMQKYMTENSTEKGDEWEQASQALGMMLGGASVDKMVDNLVSSDNYLLFSTTKINWEGRTKIIGIGIFGNVFVTSKLDKEMETGTNNQDSDLSKSSKETQNNTNEDTATEKDNKTSLPENLIEKDTQQVNEENNQDSDYFSNDDIVVDGISYGQYSNSKFKFSIPYPKDFIVEKSSNEDGRVFSGKNAELRVYGNLTSLNMEIEDLFERSKEKEKESNSQVIYERLVDNWFVLSGYNENGKIYYQKTVRDENSADITAILTFDESEKPYYDKVIKYIFKNLKTQYD